jgi:SCF-associated factor 1
MKLGYPGHKQRQPGTVSKVVAGWNATGVLVEGHGINLLFSRRRKFYMMGVPFLSELDVVEDPDVVVDFAIGERFLMAATASGKVFAANMADIERNEPIAPMQMLNFEAPAGRLPINRIVGWFRKFALFNDDGLVYIVDDVQDLQASRQHLEAAGGPRGLSHTLKEMRTSATTPTMVAGLEAYTVIDVAFGDWHCLALTDTGKVLSWGTESRTCGCLGLGRPDVAGLSLTNVYDGVLDTAQVVSFDHPHPEDEARGDGMSPSGQSYHSTR